MHYAVLIGKTNMHSPQSMLISPIKVVAFQEGRAVLVALECSFWWSCVCTPSPFSFAGPLEETFFN
jgi:hypothetical protein